MKKIILGVLVLLFSHILYAEIGVEMAPSRVTLGETFKLMLSQEDPQNGGVPNLTVLQKDFTVVGTERSISYTIINGQSQSLSLWIVTLKPKKEGMLTIPSIKIGMDQSQPASIEVLAGTASPQDEALASQNQDIMISANINDKKAYINQQIIYTVKLYNSKRLLDAEYQGPEVENALLIPLGDTRRYKTILHDVDYAVEEQTYAIFPQKSGELIIKSPIFTALVYDLNPQKARVKDKDLSIKVVPIPKGYDSSLWLPAQQVKISEVYEDSSQKLGQGSTLTRIVTIEGTGIPAQLLPNLQLEGTQDFKAYPEKGKERNQIIQGELISSKEIKVTYLFNKSGKVTIPELKLSWFNTKTGVEEKAILPPRSFEISPSSTANDNVNLNETPLIQEQKGESPVAQPEIPMASSSLAWYLAIGLGLAWVITLTLWMMQRRLRFSTKGHYKGALKELNNACKECNPTKARDALIRWARLYWPDADILNLTDLTQLTRDVHLKKQLTFLSQALYKTDQKALWRGDELWRAVQAMKPKASSRKKKASLPPINPY